MVRFISHIDIDVELPEEGEEVYRGLSEQEKKDTHEQARGAILDALEKIDVDNEYVKLTVDYIEY